MNAKSVGNSRARSRTTLFAAIALGCGSLLAGCGGDSDPLPYSDFTGIWDLEVTADGASPFQTNCSDPMNGTQALGVAFGGMRFERGTLTDLVETGWECRVTYDVQGKLAVAANPDPYTALAPECSFLLGFFTDQAGVETAVFATVQPADRWSFSIQAAQPNKAPTATLDISARVMRTDLPLIEGAQLIEFPACPFVTNPIPTLLKVTKD